MRSSGFADRKTQLKRSPLRRVGKIGRANSKARSLISEYASEMNLKCCEIGLSGCMKIWPLAPAHRHKRAWYNGNIQLLSDPNQWVCACQSCHDKIEHNATLTEETFMKLRGIEQVSEDQEEEEIII